MFKKKLEKFVVNKIMDTMDSALNITETIQEHPLAEKIGKFVKEKTAKKEDEALESVPKEFNYVHLADVNAEEQTDKVQAQEQKEYEALDSFPEEYNYVHLTDFNAEEEQTEKALAQGSMLGSQIQDVPPMPSTGEIPPMPGSVPQVSYMVGVNGQQVGPCDWNQLQQLVQHGQLTQQTYVWKQGMPQWQLAGKVMELAPLFQDCAPQMPPMPGM